MPTQKRATLYSLLREVAATEDTLARVWGWGQQMLTSGRATPEQLATIDMLTERLYQVQITLARPIMQAVYSLPAQAREQAGRLIPQPQRFPRLSNGGSGTAAPAIRTSGLGILPALAAIPPGVLFAATVLAAVAIVGALVAVFYQSEMVGDFIQDVIALRADAADAQRRIEAQQARYNNCLAQPGATPQSCAAAFPLPEPTRFANERRDDEEWPAWLTALAGLGGLVAVGGLLYVGVRAYRAASPYRALKEALP